MNSEPVNAVLSGRPEVKAMADASISKLVSKTVADTKAIGNSQAKVSPSKFDQVRAKLEQPLASSSQRSAQGGAKISAQEGKRLEVEFKNRLDQVRQRDLNEIFKADLQESKKQVDAIRQKLAAQPSSPALEPVKDRLLQVENQFLESGRLLRGLGKLDSPQDYLKMQLEMYRLTQNVELLSKVAGEAVSGVNKVLSTQV
jgi:type III secretion system YscI/HrpB-like protein